MDKLTLPKFNGHEFSVWKFQMETVFEFQGLMSIIDGTEVKPENAENAETWLKSDRKARMLIGHALESAQIRQVMNLKTANEMWIRLQSLYELKNSTSIHLLLQKFFEYKMEPGMNIATHVSTIEEMARQLEDLGHKQTEMSLVTKVLHLLPSNFRHVISAWDSMPQNEQTMANLLPRLLKEEVLNSSMSKLKIDDNDSAALYSKHMKYTKAHKASTNAQKHIKVKFTGQCHHCGKKGHKKSECWKFREEKKQEQANSASAGSSGEKFAVFTAVYSSSVNQHDIWFADSGASEHMTNRREWFETFEPINKGEMTITLGNGQVVYAAGRGNIRIESIVKGKKFENILTNALFQILVKICSVLDQLLAKE